MRQRRLLAVAGVLITTTMLVPGFVASADQTEGRDPSPVDNWWHYKGMYGNGVGGALQKERLVVADLDGDGVVEILAGAGVGNVLDPADFFFIASYRPDTGDYPMDFLSPAILEGAETIAAADVDDDGVWEIFLGHDNDVYDAEIRVFAGDPPVSVRTLNSSLYEVTTFRFYRPTPGASPWLLASDLWGKTAIFDTETWTLLTEIPFGAIDFEIGDVTGDGDVELVYSSGEVVTFDGSTATLLHAFDWGDSAAVELIQLDGDPALEMVSGGGGESVRAWDFGNPTPLWTLPEAADMVRVVDVTGDGLPEIVLTTGIVTCINPSTQAVMWTYEPTGIGSDGINSFAAADVDADGVIELVLGTGIDSFDPDAFFVVDAETQTEEWRTYQRDRATFRSSQIADLDADGDLEIIFATMFGEGGTHPPPWEGGWIHIVDAATHEQIYYSQAIRDPGVPTQKVLDIRIGDVDDDDDDEVVVATQLAGSAGHVLIYDAATMSKETEFDFSTMASLLAIEIGDVDDDGHTEIVGITYSSVTAYDNRIWVLDGATGVIEWAGPELPGYLATDIEIGNLDSDPALEMIATTITSIFDKNVVIVDGASHDTWVSPSDVYSSVATMDLNGNGRDTVLLGMDTGDVIALDDDGLGGFTQTFRVAAIDEEVLALTGYRLPGTSEPRLALTSGDGRLVGFDPVTATVVWQSDPILSYPGWWDAIDTAPISTDTGTMFLVGGAHTVYQFGGVVEPPTIRLSSASYAVGESNGSVAIVAQRLGTPDGEVAVDYGTNDGTAVDGQDYTAVSGTLVWPHLDTSDKTVLVPILDDDDTEGPENFGFTLFNPAGGVLGSPSAATVTIDDDDTSTIALSAAAIDIDETAGSVSLSVTRTGDTSAAASVAWATVDGTAVAGEDYTAASDTISWPAGNGDPATIVITILDDALFEADESFTVELSSPGGNAFLGEPSSATVTIHSDDTNEIVFSAAFFAAGEGAGNATITAWRTGATNGAVTADYATADGTATAGSDYTSTTGTLSWADGDVLPKTFDVPLLDDGDIEANETVLLTLANPTGGATIGTPGAAELVIEDDDGTLLRLTAGGYTTSETGGSVAITVERFGGDAAGAASIDFATADDTATAGLDYLATSGTLSWADGDSDDKSFSVPILDDGVLEGTESLTVTLTNPTGSATLGSPAGAAIEIIDDEWVERLINTETNQSQTRPDVAMNADGGAVVVWESYLQDGSGWGIFGQRFDDTGTPAGLEFQVNSGSSGDQRYPAATMRSDGSFTVVWVGSDGAGNGVRGRSFDASGSPLGGDFTVNLTTTGDQTEPDVAVDGSGVGLVVWQTDAGGDLEIRGRRLDASGSAVGAELVINATTANDQQHPAVAGAEGGGFVAAWQSYGQDGPADGIIARLFTSAGAPAGAEVIANEWTSGNQISPAVGRAADGSFLVAWEDTTNKDGSGSSIRARWFDAAAAPLGGDVQINTYWLDDQMNPTVACAGPGNALIAWESENQDGSNLGIFAQALGHDGVSSGAELRINTFVTGIQYRPAIADSASGAFWTTWASGAQDGSGDGVYGLFSAAPVVTLIFADGFESGNTSAWSLTVP